MPRNGESNGQSKGLKIEQVGKDHSRILYVSFSEKGGLRRDRIDAGNTGD